MEIMCSFHTDQVRFVLLFQLSSLQEWLFHILNSLWVLGLLVGKLWSQPLQLTPAMQRKLEREMAKREG